MKARLQRSKAEKEWLADWVSRNDNTVRRLPIYVTSVSPLVVLINSGVLGIADASRWLNALVRDSFMCYSRVEIGQWYSIHIGRNCTLHKIIFALLLSSTIQDDFPLIKSGYGACRRHSSAVYMFELNGEIHEDNVALLDGVDYARIQAVIFDRR
ncbi:hypothetical protein RHSIM_Rhsim03G0260900 [Rhododendron simsii]|uniref:Uncharacterized protein n=1 Tax=Rhododendron simsii TaxID=118357 RepID=A0A834LPX8_RHOSS|nr:hypothetical protein RHSIM_Rhsim03G0260900 [Rhododendron simsii]